VIEAYLLEMERRGNDPGTFTMAQLHHVLADLFGAGTDTAMTTIKWVLLYMIRHPDVQVRSFSISLARNDGERK
jgi:ecdysteroid 25-hydroxylase